MSSFSDEINARNGAPVCEFDYSTGEIESLLPNCCVGRYLQQVTTAETGVTQTQEHNWGGSKLSECYDGASFVDEAAILAPDGFPVATFVYMNRMAHVEQKRYEGAADKAPTTAMLANFWDPDDHDGGKPAALEGFAASPYYEFRCEDDAEEQIARIRILVREWNEEKEFDTEGNPDTKGDRDMFDSPINDIPDWRDLTPDDVSFPEIPRMK